MRIAKKHIVELLANDPCAADDVVSRAQREFPDEVDTDAAVDRALLRRFRLDIDKLKSSTKGVGFGQSP